jgi:hypothetical protein
MFADFNIIISYNMLFYCYSLIFIIVFERHVEVAVLMNVRINVKRCGKTATFDRITIYNKQCCHLEMLYNDFSVNVNTAVPTQI